jgi:hypothetical protein
MKISMLKCTLSGKEEYSSPDKLNSSSEAAINLKKPEDAMGSVTRHQI